MKRLSPEREAELLNEMALADFLTEKAWKRRYGVSSRTLRRLRARVREERAPAREAGMRPDALHIVCFTTQELETAQEPQLRSNAA